MTGWVCNECGRGPCTQISEQEPVGDMAECHMPPIPRWVSAHVRTCGSWSEDDGCLDSNCIKHNPDHPGGCSGNPHLLLLSNV